MSEQSAIQWTDATWNPVRGCVKVSPGCAHCYAETFAERWRGVKGHPYEQGFDLRVVPEKLAEPLSWKKPRRIFVNSMSDLFQDGVPDSFIDRVFAVMALCPQHTFQVLTKRAARMRDYCASDTTLGRLIRVLAEQVHGIDGITAKYEHNPDGFAGFVLPNVWLGVSVENQHFADERIPLLLQTPAAIRFISAEPLLGPIDLEAFFRDELAPGHVWRECMCEEIDPSDRPCVVCMARRGLDWVIVGGESGAGARPFEVAWARSIVRKCQTAGVPCFVKQLGAHVIDRNDAGFEGDTPTSWPMDTELREHIHGYREEYQGAPVRIPLRKKGGEPTEWPADLRVREYPEARV